MRIYSAADEEALRARKLLKDWSGEGFLTAEQHQRLQQETVCPLRRTNIFLRLVLFLFTLIIAGATAGLFFVVFLSHPAESTKGLFLLIFAGVTYTAAEVAASEAGLYRYGIEEALAACSVGFLCAGMKATFFTGNDSSEFLVPAAGALLSLWIWRRFGLSYWFLAAMIFVVFLPHYRTSSPAAQHVMVALFYAAALSGVVLIRERHRFDYLNDGYGLVEAFLWSGVYLAINLQLVHWWGRGLRADNEFSRHFYWSTWVAIWCVPPLVLARGVTRKDRFVIITGAILAILTLVTNKPYLGWPRHTWDPMLLGVLLIGVAFSLRRWLASGQSGSRHGFTPERLSGDHKRWLSAGSAVFGLMSPHSTGPAPQSTSPGVRFGGGDSAGGGATSDF